MSIRLTLLCILFYRLLLTQASAQSPVHFRAGYFGPTLSVPGVRLSADYALLTYKHPKIHRADTVAKCHQLLVSGGVGFYSRTDWQRALFVLPVTGYQHIGKRGFIKTVLAGAGWLYLMTPRTAYTDQSGNTLRVNAPAESMAMYSVETALGWTYRLRQGAGWGWSVRPSAFWYTDRAGAKSGNLTLSVDIHIQLHKH